MGAHIIYWSLLEMCYVCKSTVTQVETDGMVLCEMTINIKLLIIQIRLMIQLRLYH